VQIAAQSGGADLNLPNPDLAEKAALQFTRAARKGAENQMLFDAMTRWMVEKDPSFLD